MMVNKPLARNLDLRRDEPVVEVLVLCLSPPRASLTLFMSPDMLAVRCNGCRSIEYSNRI